ncbi:MAG TPA: hypothetical protein VM285_01880 [Polyangia bacterium]|nr:hypothetical protein [Polyangia bacterium]
MGNSVTKDIKKTSQQNAAESEHLRQALLGYMQTGRMVGGPGGMTLQQMGFTGDVVAPPGQMLSQAFQQAQDFGAAPDTAARTAAINQMLSGSYGDPALRERFLQQTVTDPAQQFYDQTVAPSIAARYGRGGNLGAAQWATAQAGGQLAGNLAGQRAGILRGDELLGAQRQQAAIPLSYQNQIAPMSLLSQYGNMSRDIVGQQNQQRLQEAYMSQPFGDPRWGMMGMMGQGSVTTPGQIGSPNASGSLGGAGAGLLGSLLTGPSVGGGVVGSILNPVGTILGSIFG